MKHTFSPGSLKYHLSDGCVVDVSATAHLHGLWGNVVLSRATWDECVRVPEHLLGVDDESGRLSTILLALASSVAERKASSKFDVWVLRRPNGASVVVELMASYTVFESGPPAIQVDLALEWGNWSRV